MYKGHRIRARNQHLIYHFVLGWLLALFIGCMSVFYFQELRQFEISKLSFSTSEIDWSTKDLICLLGSFALSGGMILLYIHFFQDHWRSLWHRQKLARMILENHWYEVKQTQSEGFFKDLNGSRTKESISYFPKIYYRMKDGLLSIRVQISLGKYQDQLLKLEKKLESGLYCELVEKELKDSYVDYTLLYDMIANRIGIEEAVVENGALRLMKNQVWAYDFLPHMLIAGGTGGGKTYFLLTIIEALLKSDAELFILDPKNADLADLGTIMTHVYSQKEQISACVEDFYERMMVRSRLMKEMPNYKTGENYAYLGLSPNFLVFDEYVAYMEMLTTKESAVILNKLK
ncbi:MAG: FtsK/SpoIIIE domain-containing protein, partial [Finegoldia magna]